MQNVQNNKMINELVLFAIRVAKRTAHTQVIPYLHEKTCFFFMNLSKKRLKLLNDLLTCPLFLIRYIRYIYDVYALGDRLNSDHLF